MYCKQTPKTTNYNNLPPKIQVLLFVSSGPGCSIAGDKVNDTCHNGVRAAATTTLLWHRKRKFSNGGTPNVKDKETTQQSSTRKMTVASASSGQAPSADGSTDAAAGEAGKSGDAPESGGGGGCQRNPHGITLDVEDEAKPTHLQHAFQCHIHMACGLLTADVVLGAADNYLDHYDKRFNNVDDMEAHMKTIIAEVKKLNRDAMKCAERLIKEVKVLGKGEGSNRPGMYGQIAKDITMIPAEHIALVFGITCAGLKTFHPGNSQAHQPTYILCPFSSPSDHQWHYRYYNFMHYFVQ
ncbi:hypothetical protein B0H14DRAFT_2594563 [Mycena olivaceomarginata]|nr:hypothetical protein B0H14DRAFT_2594563 [Mycena olivaceomarginata]